MSGDGVQGGVVGTHRSQRATLAPILYAALAVIYGALGVMGLRSEGITATSVIYGALVVGWLWLG
jgi:hypothetical protein